MTTYFSLFKSGCCTDFTESATQDSAWHFYYSIKFIPISQPLGSESTTISLFSALCPHKMAQKKRRLHWRSHRLHPIYKTPIKRNKLSISSLTTDWELISFRCQFAVSLVTSLSVEWFFLLHWNHSLCLYNSRAFPILQDRKSAKKHTANS